MGMGARQSGFLTGHLMALVMGFIVALPMRDILPGMDLISGLIAWGIGYLVVLGLYRVVRDEIERYAFGNGIAQRFKTIEGRVQAMESYLGSLPSNAVVKPAEASLRDPVGQPEPEVEAQKLAYSFVSCLYAEGGSVALDLVTEEGVLRRGTVPWSKRGDWSRAFPSEEEERWPGVVGKSRDVLERAQEILTERPPYGIDPLFVFSANQWRLNAEVYSTMGQVRRALWNGSAIT